MKRDVKIERWSARRDLDRTGSTIAFRVSDRERKAIEDAAAEHRVQTSDVIRGSLIYAGVVEEIPVTPQQKEQDHADA